MINHRAFNCPRQGCSAVTWLDAATEDKLRSTHETFYCPAGHDQWFPEKTEQEKEIDLLTRQLNWAREELDWYADKVRNIEATCPWTGCGFVGGSPRSRTVHMQRAHGMPSLAAVKAAS